MAQVVRVGVIGAGGRMGREVCRTVLEHPGLELACAVDPAYEGSQLTSLVGRAAGDMEVDADADALARAGTDVAVDFTRIEAARVSLPVCAAAGIHAVVGTTGATDGDLDAWRRLFAGPEAGAPNCVAAANFAIGAVLLMRFCELAAPHFEAVEIIELHHAGKLDAPSGTSLATAERIAAAREEVGVVEFPADRTATTVIEGVRGGSGPGGVRIHSVRLPGLVAHQEVVFGAPGQTLSLRHDSTDRASFMDGVVLAIETVAERPGLTVGLEPLLGL